MQIIDLLKNDPNISKEFKKIIDTDLKKIIDEKGNLKGRKAKCRMCQKVVDSNINLPIFEYCENEKYDEYYCGCIGWD